MPYLCHFFLRPDSCPHEKAVYVLIHPLGLSIKHLLYSNVTLLRLTAVAAKVDSVISVSAPAGHI